MESSCYAAGGDEFDPDAAGDRAHHVLGRAVTEGFGSELDIDAVDARDALVERLQRRLVLYRECQVMKSDAGSAVEGSCALGLGGLPQRDHHAAVRQECGGVVRNLADLLVAERIDEERSRLVQIRDGESYVVNAAGGGLGGIVHRVLLLG
jgi:hypothetical protein